MNGMGGKSVANQYIYVGSITNAMRGKKLLEEQGIRAYLHRASHPAEGDGCGYSLLVTGNGEKAVQTLREKGVRIIRIKDAL